MKRSLFVICCITWVLFAGMTMAQETTTQNSPAPETKTENTAQPAATSDMNDEGDIFSDSESVVPVEQKVDEKLTDVITEESKTFSGEVAAKFGYYLTRDYLEGDSDFEDNPYSTSVEGDFLLDIRLRNGIKSFIDFYAIYSPQDAENSSDNAEIKDDDHLDTMLKEFFVDVNIGKKVYFRAGKQNLKWGRGYFWNPTDVISEDRKDFQDMDARLEGVYGLKMSIPFGTKYNIYTFINASGANKTKELSFAGKFEVLLPKNVEMGLSAWSKDGYRAVYGMDFAAHGFNTDFRGEISLSHGDNRHRLNVEGEEFVDERVSDWMPRICLGFTKEFDHKDVNNRISITGEFYYNDGGYEKNMLEEPTRTQFLEGNYFEPGNYGKYYAALFSSYQKFIVSDMTLNVNAIGNLSDSSFMILSGVNYELTNNATLNVNVDGYFGSKNREYTFAGNAISAEAIVNLAF